MQIPRLTSDLLNQKLRVGPSGLNLIKLLRHFLSVLKCEKCTVSYRQLSDETDKICSTLSLCKTQQRFREVK